MEICTARLVRAGVCWGVCEPIILPCCVLVAGDELLSRLVLRSSPLRLLKLILFKLVAAEEGVAVEEGVGDGDGVGNLLLRSVLRLLKALRPPVGNGVDLLATAGGVVSLLPSRTVTLLASSEPLRLTN